MVVPHKKEGADPNLSPNAPFYLCQVWDLNPTLQIHAKLSFGALDLSANLTLVRSSSLRPLDQPDAYKK